MFPVNYFRWLDTLVNLILQTKVATHRLQNAVSSPSQNIQIALNIKRAQIGEAHTW